MQRIGVIENSLDAVRQCDEIDCAVEYDGFGRQITGIVGVDLLRDPDSVLCGRRADRQGCVFHERACSEIR